MPGDQNAVIIDRRVLEAEVDRIVDAAETVGTPLRVLGSIGVAMHCPDASSLIERFDRTYGDIDLAAYRRDAPALASCLIKLGYREDREVTINSEGRRLIFDHAESRIHLDVFFDELEFCHTIPLRGRLEADRPTIPLAELLLSKLQIVKLNQKDAIDASLVLLDHELGTGDADTIDLARITGLCAGNWGWWRTLTLNLAKVAMLAASYPQLDGPQRGRVIRACDDLKRAIDAVPKSRAWRLRDRVGDRRQWWTDVDEVR